MSYPLPNQKVSTRDLEDAGRGLAGMASRALALAQKAEKAFGAARDQAAAKGARDFAQIARAALRSAGEERPELDGPGWARFDALCGLRVGVAAKQSDQSIARAEAKARFDAASRAWEAGRAGAYSEERARKESAEAAVKAQAEREAARKAFGASAQAEWSGYFQANGCSSISELDEKLKGVGFFARLFSTPLGALAKNWESERPKALAALAGRDRLVAAETVWRGAETALAAAEEAPRRRAALSEELVQARRAAEAPAQWLDKGSRVDAESIYGMVAGAQASALMEPAMVALAARCPALRPEARASVRQSLVCTALDVTARNMGKEAKDLGALADNMEALATKMRQARQRSSSGKGSVKFDMAELHAKISRRTAQLEELSRGGPAKALATLEALDWEKIGELASEVTPEQAQSMAKAAEAKFGPGSAPAAAFASRSSGKAPAASSALDGGSGSAAASSSSDSSSFLFWFWLMNSSGSDAHASAAPSAVSGFDVGAGGATWAADGGAASPEAFDFSQVGLGSSDVSFDAGAGSSASWSSSSCSSSSCSSSSSSSSGPSSSCSSSSSSSSSSCSSSSSSCGGGGGD